MKKEFIHWIRWVAVLPGAFTLQEGKKRNYRRNCKSQV